MFIVMSAAQIPSVSTVTTQITSPGRWCMKGFTSMHRGEVGGGGGGGC